MPVPRRPAFPRAEDVRVDPDALALRHFHQLVGTLQPEQFRLATPCPGWTVAALVRHVETLRPEDHPLRSLDVAAERIRTAELVVHAWDLAVAVGVDSTLPEPLVRVGLEVFEPLAADLAELGCFGDGPVHAPATTSTQSWLLHLAGRRP